VDQKTSAAVKLGNLLDTPELPSLGPDVRASRQNVSDLERRLGDIFKTAGFSSAQQNLIRGLIYLWHDHLDESHTLSQDIHSADGCFVHGIMHRREPDASNAKYWFHRVGQHAAFPEIVRRTKELLASAADRLLEKKLIPNGQWDPFAFIDLCNEAREQGRGIGLLQRVQEIETRVLLEHFCR
jgi:hypothetical protein